MPTTPEQRFDHLVSSAGPRPFVTYYDEATGERSELSVRSLANWVAKTHHLLVDELGLGVGDRAAVQLPAHWISVPVLLGCLTAGLELTDDLDDVAVAFVEGPVAAPDDGALDVYAVNPVKAAVGFGADVPSGTNDYVAAVRPQADTWPSVSLTAGADDPCLPGLTRAEADERAAVRAAELGLTAGGRVLSTVEWRGTADWIDAVLAPLAVGGSLVLVRNAPDDATVERRVQQERATARLP